jgi:hypothetical protein
MVSLMIFMTLLPAGQPGGSTLMGEVSGPQGRKYSFSSTLAMGRGAKPGSVITDALTNDLTNMAFRFTTQHGEKGFVREAEKKGGETIPRSITMVRTSYRPAKEDDTTVDGVAEGSDFAFSPSCWVESDVPAKAFPGGKLEAKLIDGDEKGKVLVRCVSEVTGDKEKGYAYAYTVENLTDKPVQFKWAGLEGKIEPKKSFTKSERSDMLTKEHSELLTLDFGEKREFAIRANLWAMPK